MAQTAALLKPSQKVLDALRDYVVKIDSEKISDYPLKASLISEALTRYNVTPQVLAETLAKPVEVVQAYLAQAINPAQTGRGTFKPDLTFREIDRAKVERQLRAMRAALGIAHSGSISEAQALRDMSEIIAAAGVDDLANIAAHHATQSLPVGTQVLPDGSGVYLYQDYPIPADKVKADQVYDAGTDSWGNTYTLAQPVELDTGADYIFNKVNGRRVGLAYGLQSPDQMQFEANYEGKGGTIYYVKFLPTGLPVIWSQFVNTSDLGTVLMLAGFAAAMFGLPALLGENILAAVGLEAGATVNAAVGNLAINTAITGGDVVGSVSKAATSLASGYVGGQIGVSADSVAIGKAAEIATAAALQGKNIDVLTLATALASTGAKQGNASMDETDFSTVDPFDMVGIETVDYVYDPNAVLPDVAYEGDFTFEDIGLDTSTAVDIADSLDTGEMLIEFPNVDDLGNIYTPDGGAYALTEASYIASFYPDAEGIKDGYNNVVIPADQVQGMTDEEIAQEIQRYMAKQSGAEINAGERTENTPAANPATARTVKMPTLTEQASTFDKLLKTAVSIGASVKAIASGTFRASYPTSMYGMPRAAVGVPVQRADGSVVTNNGNGTQTIRYPDGRVQTVSTNYAGSGVFGGISTQTLLIGGAVLLGAVLLARR